MGVIAYVERERGREGEGERGREREREYTLGKVLKDRLQDTTTEG